MNEELLNLSENYFCDMQHYIIKLWKNWQGWTYLNIFVSLTSKILHVSIQIVYELQDKSAKIHLSDWQMYLPWGAKQQGVFNT